MILQTRRSSRGFTIVEFMIATSVFGVVLLGVTAAIIHMSQVYQRSIYASNTQSAAVNLVDTLSQAIKFSSSQIETASHGSGTKSYCVGNRQFLYVIGKQLDGSNPGTKTQNAVMTRLNNNCQVETIFSGTPSGSPKELLGKGMRLVNLSVVSSSPGLYTVTARVVYGDDDLLCSPSLAGSCESANTMSPTELQRPDIMCRPGAGAQFCSVSELSNTVYRRL